MNRLFGFLGEWTYRILISPLLLIVWWEGRKKKVGKLKVEETENPEASK